MAKKTKKSDTTLPVNTVLYGKSEELVVTLPDNCIDLIVTSPPYAQVKSYGKEVECFDEDIYPVWFADLSQSLCRILKPTGSFILNINDCCSDKQRSTYVFETVCRIVKSTPLKLYDRYIWAKKAGLPGGGDRRLNDRMEYIFHFCKDPDKMQIFPDESRVPYAAATLSRQQYEIMVNDKVNADGKTIAQRKMVSSNAKGCIRTTVFDFNTAATENHQHKSFHPAHFNEEMPTFFIKWLTKREDVVLDPFMGSGTTAVAAIKLSRKYIGFELNKKYKPEVERRLVACEKRDSLESHLFDINVIGASRDVIPSKSVQEAVRLADQQELKLK